jgi:uncharacterized cupin superfamily protein
MLVKNIHKFSPTFWAFTVGNVYTVISESETCYKLTDNIGITREAHKKYFEVVSNEK